MRTCIICQSKLEGSRRKLCGAADCERAYNAQKQQSYRQRRNRAIRNEMALQMLSTTPKISGPPIRYFGGKWRVGKNYTYQLSKTPASGIFEGRRFNSYMGNSCLQDVVEDFNADNFDHSDLDFIGGASIACGGGEREPISSAHNLMATSGNTTPQTATEEKPPRQHLPLASEFGSLIGGEKQWGREWKENLRNNWDSSISIGIQYRPIS